VKEAPDISCASTLSMPAADVSVHGLPIVADGGARE